MLYYTGARPTIDGKKGQTRANARVGLTLTLYFLGLRAEQRIGNLRVVWFVPIRFADGERKGCRELECESHPKMLFLCRF